MFWIALYLPQLPLDLALRSRPDSVAEDVPVAVMQHKRVGWRNRAACEAGIEPGMSESGARSLASGLQQYQRDLDQEQDALQEAALWALYFTPQVTLRSSGLLAEVSASLRLFDGIGRLTARLCTGMAELGLHARVASAPTATAAWLLAQCKLDDVVVADASDAMQALGSVPLQVVAAAAEHLDALAGIGCTTLGQLRSLPRAGVARRFGEQLLREIDCADGAVAEVHRWFEAPARFNAKLELPSQVESTEALLFAARRLLLQLTGWLAALHAGVVTATLWLHHESTRRRDHRSTPVTIALAHASRDIEHLTLLLRERLAQTALSAPVIELALTADHIVTLAAPNSELFSTPAAEAESLGRLIERLQSRLGNDAVCQLIPHADHRPEKSYTRLPITHRVGNGCGNRRRAAAHVESTRPAWLLPQPLPLDTVRDKPFYQGLLTLLAGPERVEAGWWDDALETRDYFIAENERHMLLWVFRERPLAEKPEAGWFLHGFFG